MKLRRKKTPIESATDAVRTNPAVPVAGATGFALLGAALMRRRRGKKAT
jgi:MYXO-CTERM domain-containing protein